MKVSERQKIKTKKIPYREALIPKRGQKQLIEIWLANIETQINRKKLKNEFHNYNLSPVHCATAKKLARQAGKNLKKLYHSFIQLGKQTFSREKQILISVPNFGKQEKGLIPEKIFCC